MKIKEFSGVEQFVNQGEDGEQKFFVLPDEEAVEKLLAKLREDGVSDTIQLSLSRHGAGQDSKQHDTLLDDMASRLQGITDNPAAETLTHTMEKIEELLGEEYLAIDGEQKVYVLPEGIATEQLLGNLKGLRAGEIKQSQMWRKTEIQMSTAEEKHIIEAMDKRIQRLETLLNQAIGQNVEAGNKENK